VAKLFNIVLFILGISSLINGFSHLPSNILLASVNLIATVILLYVSIKMFKAGKEENSGKSSKTK